MKVKKKNSFSIAIDGASASGKTTGSKYIAKKFGFKLKGSVLASDAFLPFKDNIEILIKYKIKSIIQTGGSKMDKKIINIANNNNISMIFTKIRHFYH